MLEKKVFPEEKIRQNIYNKALGEEAKGPSAAPWLEELSLLLAGGGHQLQWQCLPVQSSAAGRGLRACENTSFCQAASVCVESRGA